MCTHVFVFLTITFYEIGNNVSHARGSRARAGAADPQPRRAQGTWEAGGSWAPPEARAPSREARARSEPVRSLVAARTPRQAATLAVARGAGGRVGVRTGDMCGI